MGKLSIVIVFVELLCSTSVNVVCYSRLAYHQFLIENIPEGLHTLVPVTPVSNYRFQAEQGIN